eukprot:TRINITY_DN6048_c0_g1_i1.p2 TRINITY_DN6048_c0_g1~~TRINITY_DN6048_c0_g1_i1.p2  ORF type:complete len:148 (+),score=37.52 TRINITY_DN6048_c0_g1_i1:286-729(+)
MEVCQVCTVTEFKYRCPKCDMLYCSVNCYKQHHTECEIRIAQKDNNTTLTTPSQMKETMEGPPGFIDDQDNYRIPFETLQLLNDDPELIKLLSNVNLQRDLKDVMDAEDSFVALEEKMKFLEFAEVMDKILKVIKVRDEQGYCQIEA